MKRETDYGYVIKPVYTPNDLPGFDYHRDWATPAPILTPAAITPMAIAAGCGPRE